MSLGNLIRVPSWYTLKQYHWNATSSEACYIKNSLYDAYTIGFFTQLPHP